MTDKPKNPPPGRVVWPFPPATGPVPWTAAQIREYNRQQQQPPKDAPPAPW